MSMIPQRGVIAPGVRIYIGLYLSQSLLSMSIEYVSQIPPIMIMSLFQCEVSDNIPLSYFYFDLDFF